MSTLSACFQLPIKTEGVMAMTSFFTFSHWELVVAIATKVFIRVPYVIDIPPETCYT